MRVRFVEDLAKVRPSSRTEMLGRFDLDPGCVKPMAMVWVGVSWLQMNVVVANDLDRFTGASLEHLVFVDDGFDPSSALPKGGSLIALDENLDAVDAMQRALPVDSVG
jgi:hypothetical protein